MEILGTISGLLYIWFSIRQNILLWPLGFITSAFYIYIFFKSGFYADMGLQVYYLVISVYGWMYWHFGNKNPGNKNDLPVIKLSPKGWIASVIVTAILTFAISGILIRFTNSTIPWWDAFTTAASITATWMLARKYIDNWLFWIVIDSVSAGLYLYKGLYPTFVLFIVYTVMAFAGFREWFRSLPKKF